MGNWLIEKKVAATLALLLLGLGYLAGLASLTLSVGATPEAVRTRYSAKPSGMEMALDEAPPISAQKLVHVAHAHMIPYTLVFALLAFFVVQFRWSSRAKIAFLVFFALSIPLDFLGMAGTRFLHPSLYIVIMASGLLFGASIAITIIWAMYELWLAKQD
jgi:hypothetical protein